MTELPIRYPAPVSTDCDARQHVTHQITRQYPWRQQAMTRRARFTAAAAFFLIAGTISGFFSYTGLEAANKWSSIISMFLALASFTLSALLCHQSIARRPPIPPASRAPADT